MKILAYANKYSGCSYHRVILPLQSMGNVDAQITNKIEAFEPKEYDILFFNRITNTYDNNLELARKNHNCKIVVDIDDYWELPYDHLLHDLYISEISKRIIHNITYADKVFTSTEKLADKIIKLNKNVEVIPNALPYGLGQFNSDKAESSFVRIFWCGGVTHEQDIEILANPLKRLSGIHKNIKMVLGGYINLTNEEAKIWNNIMNHFTCHRMLPHDIYGAMLPDQYMQLYENADICIIPLRKGEWNSYKSNLKILEAACKKIPVIVSNVEPYNIDKDAPVLWVNKQTDWFKHLNNLINDKEKRTELGQRLYEWANKKYNIQDTNAKRKAAFESLTKS